ncbi:MBL fold metallo-hydrolase [Oscillibacter sp.]|uniref:MBL fold metallo-hydrolase n=1 Tax=Oscillibacter sp. TaxID=1945593 RepID=UPI0028971A6C|nr:MBL fold metallo-hydrolase [Oscillibacter sp.]
MKIVTMQVGAIMTNCYIFCDEEAKVCAIVDPGADADRVARAVEETGCTPVCIFLTHGHYDHTGAVAELLEQYPGIPAYLNRRDVHGDDADRRTRELFLTLPATVDYGEGDTVQVGGLTVSVLSTPGHSPGSVTLLCGEAMFAGDTLFAGSCGRTDLSGGNVGDMLASLSRLGRLEGEYTVLPGHMGPSLLSRERAYNPFMIQALGR